MLNRIYTFCQQQQLIKPPMKLIVGLSGGPDSVFLLHILHQLQAHYAGLQLIVAHLDHGWREESAQEALFCKNLAQSLGLLFITKHAREIALSRKAQSKEDMGRLLRRTFFEQLAAEYQADGIALAHHEDDQQETFFIRLIRGAGIGGLASIRAKNGLYIRPLLTIHKEEILAFLHERGFEYCIDRSNNSSEFLRNRIRMQVLPVLQQVDERFSGNFTKAIEHLQHADAYLERHTHQLLAQITSLGQDSIILDIEKLLIIDEFMHHSLILAWLIEHRVIFPVSNKFIQELLNFLIKKEPGIYRQPGWHIQKRNKKAVIIHPKQQ